MKSFDPFHKHHFFTFLLFIFLKNGSASAQLTADFIPDKNGGCSPLAISFTNTTSGASGNATYEWDFGNGNSSIIKNPAANYYTEKIYTITLTVKDGSKTSVKTKTIRVYKNPSADFTISSGKGCLPFLSSFNNMSSAGDGAISSSYWDFGDGNTQQSYSQSTTHIYSFPQTASITLTVSNSYGCTNTITKKDLLKVLPAINANFSAEKTIYCQVTDEVRFTNNSSGPGTLSYEWDFGDGTTSDLKTPLHIYSKKGIYTVKLTVKNDEGCTDILTRTSYLNIANFNSDFQQEPLVCANTTVTFNNMSSPTPDNSAWYVDGNSFYTNYGNGSAYLYIYNQGTHTIQLTNNFGECQQTISKQVDVKPSFNLQGFIADIEGVCGTPVKVNFKDTTAGAIKWKWDFGYNTSGSDVKTPSYTYTRDNNYYVTLTVSNGSGCSGTVGKYVYVSKPLVGIFATDGSGDFACSSIKKTFMARSTEEITDYSWNFGDGTVNSTEKEPQHVFNTPGIYTVTLKYTTINGCTSTVSYYNNITVYTKPVAAFASPASVCGNTPVYFTNQSTSASNFTWDFGDGGVSPDNFHKYQAEGNYTIRLIAYNGYCRDTVEKQNILKVYPPFPKIGNALNTCEGTRGTITFPDASTQAASWQWNFGDGNTITYTATTPEIRHEYTKSGKYKVVLTNTNNGCIVKDSATVYVLLKQKPILSASAASVCSGNSISIQVSNLQRPEVPYPFDVVSQYYPYYYNLQHPDGNPANIYISGYNSSLPWSASITPLINSKEALRIITNSNPYFGCTDTTNIISLEVKGPKAGFKLLSDNTCFRNPVYFQDTSQVTNNIAIIKWEWDFGDGQTQVSSNNNPVSHTYKNPGYYYVVLKVTDAGDCTSSTDYYSHITTIDGPLASFSPSGTNVPLNSTVNFNNTTTNFSSPVNYKWDFGDGQISTEYSPNHTYIIAGTYIVQLVAINTQTQCSDTAKQVITVRNFNTAFLTRASFIGNNGRCAPVVANFTNTSVNYTRVVWDFGDGFTLENQNYPSHVYKDPGTYIVTLYVYGYNGLTGTYKDSVIVGAPAVTIKTDITEGCTGTQVRLSSQPGKKLNSYSWDFGNGNVITNTDSFALHAYMIAGIYSPSLITTDANGCSASVPLQDKITIWPDPVIDITPIDPVVCKGSFIQLQASGGNSYTWSPADGLNNANSSSPLASPSENKVYTVNSIDDKGCRGSNKVTVTVAQPLKLKSNPDVSICAGNIIQLNTTGAYTYKWINEITGLSDTQIANPSASPVSTINYTVVGYDQYGCFTDTAAVNIIVYPLPVIEAGPDIEVIIGSEVKLSPSASNDVVKWTWSPSDYLNCNNCPSPASKPRSPVEYTITVQNQYNCTTKDKLKINTVCAGGQVYIPSAFSPNNDGKNDRFYILGNGVRIIKSLRIYNRWGNLVFERKNFYPDDNSAAWDGTFKGAEAPAGTYVFIAEMECNANESFTRKGTLTLLR